MGIRAGVGDRPLCARRTRNARDTRCVGRWTHAPRRPGPPVRARSRPGVHRAQPAAQARRPGGQRRRRKAGRRERRGHGGRRRRTSQDRQDPRRPACVAGGRPHPRDRRRRPRMTVVVALLAVALLGWGVFAYNRLVRLRNQWRTAWADVDVQLQRRHDLVPQLVSTVGAYAKHERATLDAVTALRARAMATHAPGALGAVEVELEQALGRLVAVVEAYPDLKASDNFLRLQRDLVEVEEHLQYARRFFNGAVRDYNTAIERVPDVLVARGFGFTPAGFFQAGADERAAVRVDLP